MKTTNRLLSLISILLFLLLLKNSGLSLFNDAQAQNKSKLSTQRNDTMKVVIVGSMVRLVPTDEFGNVNVSLRRVFGSIPVYISR